MSSGAIDQLCVTGLQFTTFHKRPLRESIRLKTRAAAGVAAVLLALTLVETLVEAKSEGVTRVSRSDRLLAAEVLQRFRLHDAIDLCQRHPALAGNCLRTTSYSGAMTGSRPGRRFTLTAVRPQTRLELEPLAFGLVARDLADAHAQRGCFARAARRRVLAPTLTAQRTDSSTPGRPFFICTGVIQTSAAPASNRRSCV